MPPKVVRSRAKRASPSTTRGRTIALEAEPRERHELAPALELLNVLWALEHALERTSVRMEEALGITAQQRFVIRILGKLSGTTPGELATMLHVDPGSITALVKRLEARKLVLRRPDPSDGRRQCIALTAKGKKLDVPTAISVERAVSDVLARSSSGDLAAMRRVLGRLVDALDAVSEAADAL